MTQPSNLVYEFGPYRLDVAERVLWRNSQPVALTPKSLDILLVLLENSGHIVEKTHLIEETWPGTFVEEGNLAQNIWVLRRVLGEGDQDDVDYIETIPRRGYRFIAPVRRVHSTTDFPQQTEGQQQPMPALPIESLAVLPFISTEGDSRVENLADGLTESIINSLSHVSRLRVMSSNCVARYRGRDVDAQGIGKELDVGAVLVGRIQSLGRRLVISAELVDVANGWRLWGESYDQGARPLLDVQAEVTQQISGALRLRLTGTDQERLTQRYTENSDAYQAYLKGRYYWSKYTSDSLHKATEFFRRAIELDPNYSLAYAGIVDCYLRLATNYIPPTEAPAVAAPAERAIENQRESGSLPEAIGLRYEWDRKTAERELGRAAELSTNYPAAHQWSVAYSFARELYEKNAAKGSIAERNNDEFESQNGADTGPQVNGNFASQFRGATLTPDEEVQVFCTIAREQMETGNYEAACAVLERWWALGEWPKTDGLRQNSSADLLFTAGALAGWLASSRKVPKGQKHSQALLSGAIAAFEQLGLKARGAEARIELGYCYYREGLFDLARTTIVKALEILPPEERALRAVGLVRLAIVERHSGHLDDSLMSLEKAGAIIETVGALVSGRYYHELGSTIKDLAIENRCNESFEKSLQHYERALSEFEAIGNHRYSGAEENNRGLLLLNLNKLDESEFHAVRARRIFEAFSDDARCGQVDETLARIYLAANRFEAAEEVAERAVMILQSSGEESFLAEAMGTHGLALSKLGRYSEAKRTLDRALQLAQTCDDEECADRVLLIHVEELADELDPTEREEAAMQLSRALSRCRKKSKKERLQRSYEMIRKLSSR